MEIFIFLRKTEDWLNVNIEDCSVNNKNKKHVKILEEWNKNFPITWQKYRHEIHQKTLKNWPLPILNKIDDVMSLNDEDVVIPMDDDDWLHCDIEPFVKSEMGNHDLSQWTQIINNQFQKQCSMWGKNKWQKTTMFSSSDHALRIGAIKQLNPKWQKQTLTRHEQVQFNFMYRKRLYSPKVMSCYNRHLGSHSFLTEVSLEKVKLPNIKRYIPSWAKWAETNILWLDRLTEIATTRSIKFL